MSGAHTPGPWVRHRGQLHGSDGKGVEVWDAGIAWSSRSETSEANAHLIAACPELLEVCEKVAALNRDAGEIGAGMLCQLVDAARAAIAKAKGEAA